VATGLTNEAVETEGLPRLIWDDEARGLCVRLYGNGNQSFIFVYRIADRQRFVRIGRSPMWSLTTARSRAKELRQIVEQGRDPAGEKHKLIDVTSVENLIHYISEELPARPLNLLD
jgi:Arm DNA-binding domain